MRRAAVGQWVVVASSLWARAALAQDAPVRVESAAQTTAAAPVIAGARVDLMARAPMGITEHDLGAYYHSAFRPLAGAAAISEAQRAQLRRTPTNERSHSFRVVSSEHELRANASFSAAPDGIELRVRAELGQ